MMKKRINTCSLAALSLGLLAATPVARAQLADLNWVPVQGDFFTASNWSPSAEPNVDAIIHIDNGGTATIAADAGDRELAWLRLGVGAENSGHIVMNGGFLRIGQTPGDEKVQIGETAVESSFIMNGGTIYFDGPDDPGMAGTSNNDGVNGLDWEVGEHGVGRFEMHGDAVFRAGDDLKVTENSAGLGYCLIDGNAQLSVGSGISVSSGGDGVKEQTLIIGGNALVEAGNSMGAGSPEGYTDEGYLSLSIGAGGKAVVSVQDQAVLNFQVLSSRDGETTFTVKDQGQVHIFNVLTGRGYIDDQTPPDRPLRDGGFRNSLSSGANAVSTLTLQDDAQMTVNASDGLGISGPRGTADAGGKATMVVRDRASFRVEQYFALGTGTDSTTCDGTLVVRGPDASFSVGENFNMAVDPDGVLASLDGTPGKSTLHEVITASTQTTVQVDGEARIANGALKVSLDGYAPTGGEVYTLISAGSIVGLFSSVDASEAVLAEGLSWELDYTPTSVLLKVMGQSTVPVMDIGVSGGDLSLSWTAGSVLESAPTLEGPWTEVAGATSPYTVQPTEAAAFFRVH
ncbi:MAG: hypothetical protein RI897_574 [Verrucomicrobiota bacterium]|jgi:hypothetical protein